MDHDEAAASTASSYELSRVSTAARRPSRTAQERPQLAPFSSAFGGFTPLDTPPITPPESNNEKIESIPPAPVDYLSYKEVVPGPSVPPTPGETEFYPTDLESGSSTPPSPTAHNSTADLTIAELANEAAPLPPVDRGRAAIMYLVAVTLIEATVWGLPFSVGVLHEYWLSELFPDPSAAGVLTLASTLPTGLLYFCGVFMGPLFTAFPWFERELQFAGLFISTAGLLASAFVTQPWQLILTFGIMFPMSGSVYLPCATNLFEWWKARRGMATGIMYAGTGLGGCVFPIVVTALLKAFGYRTTMVSLAIAYLIIIATCLCFTKRRVPLPTYVTGGRRKRTRPPVDWSFLRRRATWVGFAFMMVHSLANFIPLLWITSFATLVGAKSPDGPSLVAIVNGVTAFGNCLSGWVSDRVPCRIAVTVSCLIAAVSTATLWGFGDNEKFLLAFAVMWGLTAASLAGMWGAMITTIAQNDPSTTVVAFSAFMTLKGIASFTSGPISTALLNYGPMAGAPGAYGSTNYGVLIIFTTIMTGAGGLITIAFPG
ncbi:transporter [Trichosporon asahii var. asahii CBS 2479]|uniref:Transporter n=1 Tax=Trichosporon asahii var. asahii (strain ATCC 90039 / CBS 2479 / JCM 2466 / KCTC 7840 / NBRC 103889/ NCYC 2677 / UAMH 7654) TaxID=1186058 RepID=J6EUU0_TRIAS|nr:transporter [Trichosporon asahii var. asahii CBS 2479]EJT46537.1 transporter [Trichosporon asahii var. asahii CBS 2479]